MRMPLRLDHCRRKPLRYSGSLSHRMALGLPAQSMICSEDRATLLAGNDRSTDLRNW